MVVPSDELKFGVVRMPSVSAVSKSRLEYGNNVLSVAASLRIAVEETRGARGKREE
jgi:hypothetical protein